MAARVVTRIKRCHLLYYFDEETHEVANVDVQGLGHLCNTSFDNDRSLGKLKSEMRTHRGDIAILRRETINWTTKALGEMTEEVGERSLVSFTALRLVVSCSGPLFDSLTGRKLVTNGMELPKKRNPKIEVALALLEEPVRRRREIFIL